MGFRNVFGCEANRWNVTKFALGVICAISLARVGIALASITGVANFSEAYPIITGHPQAALAIGGFWAVVTAVLFAVTERSRRRAMALRAA
jgi:hypothetical protein